MSGPIDKAIRRAVDDVLCAPLRAENWNRDIDAFFGRGSSSSAKAAEDEEEEESHSSSRENYDDSDSDSDDYFASSEDSDTSVSSQPVTAASAANSVSTDKPGGEGVGLIGGILRLAAVVCVGAVVLSLITDPPSSGTKPTK